MHHTIVCIYDPSPVTMACALDAGASLLLLAGDLGPYESAAKAGGVPVVQVEPADPGTEAVQLRRQDGIAVLSVAASRGPGAEAVEETVRRLTDQVVLVLWQGEGAVATPPVVISLIPGWRKRLDLMLGPTCPLVVLDLRLAFEQTDIVVQKGGSAESAELSDDDQEGDDRQELLDVG